MTEWNDFICVDCGAQVHRFPASDDPPEEQRCYVCAFIAGQPESDRPMLREILFSAEATDD